MNIKKSKKQRGHVRKVSKVWEAAVYLYGTRHYIGRFKSKKLGQEAINKFLMHNEA
jgi:hypothetical protein